VQVEAVVPAADRGSVLFKSPLFDMDGSHHLVLTSLKAAGKDGGVDARYHCSIAVTARREAVGSGGSEQLRVVVSAGCFVTNFTEMELAVRCGLSDAFVLGAESAAVPLSVGATSAFPCIWSDLPPCVQTSAAASHRRNSSWSGAASELLGMSARPDPPSGPAEMRLQLAALHTETKPADWSEPILVAPGATAKRAHVLCEEGHSRLLSYRVHLTEGRFHLVLFRCAPAVIV
jgi:hypothetical protein